MLRNRFTSTAKKTEWSVGALQGHRLHRCAGIRRLQMALDTSDDKALLYTETQRWMFVRVLRDSELLVNDLYQKNNKTHS